MVRGGEGQWEEVHRWTNLKGAHVMHSKPISRALEAENESDKVKRLRKGVKCVHGSEEG